MSGARRAVAVGLAAAALLSVAVAAAGDPVPLASEGSGGWFVEPPSSGERNDSDVSDQQEDQPAGDESVATHAASALLELVVLVALSIVAVVLGRALLRRLRSVERHLDRPKVSSGPAAPTPDLTDAVEEGRRMLESGPIDDAIVACWVRLEEAAAGGGVARLPSETPTELTVRLLDRFDVPEGAVNRLLGLYRTARYSRHRLGEADRVAAVACLQAIGVAIEDGERVGT